MLAATKRLNRSIASDSQTTEICQQLGTKSTRLVLGENPGLG